MRILFGSRPAQRNIPADQQVPMAETERMMKIQEVILKAMPGKLKWWEAAEIIAITDRTMRGCRDRYEEHGYSGQWDYRKTQRSPNRVPVEKLEQVLRLYREQYHDFNVRHFHEKPTEVHDFQYSSTWVKTALQEAGPGGAPEQAGHVASGVRGGLFRV